MNDEVTKLATVTSNSQAAHLACDTKRKRVLAILALAPQGAISDAMLQAIANGTPAAIFETNQRTKAGAGNGASAGAAASSAATKGSSKWDGIAARMNEQRKGAAAPAEGSAE